MPAAMAKVKLGSMDFTHFAGTPNSFSKSNSPFLAANLTDWETSVSFSTLWFPTRDFTTYSMFLLICLSCSLTEIFSIKFLPCKISSRLPSRKTFCQLPGVPAAMPLMATCTSQGFLAGAAQAHTEAEASWAGALKPAAATKAGLNIVSSLFISVLLQSIQMPAATRFAIRSLNSVIPPRLGWLEANTLMSFLSESVLVTKALSTRLGPTSIKSLTPLAYASSTCLIHSTELIICSTIISLILEGSDG